VDIGSANIVEMYGPASLSSFAINNSPVVPLTVTLASALLSFLSFKPLSLKPNKEELIAVTRLKQMALRGFADSRLQLLCGSRFC